MTYFQDLIRVGVYTQLEGNFIKSGNNNNYRFRFSTKQIPDMGELLTRVTEIDFSNKKKFSISSQELYIELRTMGFTEFGQNNWNVLGEFLTDGEEAEYIRAIIDSIGNVDVDDKFYPIVKISSVNHDGILALQSRFGGGVYGPYKQSNSIYLIWRGMEADFILDKVDYKFYNPRNQRGVELIQMYKWREPIW